MVGLRATELFRRDNRSSGKLLSAAEREELLRPYLPQDPKAARKPKSRPIRTFLNAQLHLLVFAAIHFIFSVYIKLRQTVHAVLRRISAILYYHHRTPELIRNDVKGLSRLPRHLSVVLDLQPGEQVHGASGPPGQQGLAVLLDNVAEIAAWCASAGIPVLSVYEATGALKDYIPATHRAVAAKLHAYFGERRPSLQVRAPHQPSFLNGDGVGEEALDATDLGKLHQPTPTVTKGWRT